METKYKFHRTVKVAPGAVVAVWNSDSGVEHQPNEGQLVMKQGGFSFQDIVETALLDKDNKVVATRQTKKEVQVQVQVIQCSLVQVISFIVHYKDF